MMKKIILPVLCLMMFLCAVSADAEDAEMAILTVNQAFKIQSKIPEGYTFEALYESETNLYGMLSAGEGMPVVMLSIGYNDTYAEVERFNDVPEEVVQEIKDSFAVEETEELKFEYLETRYGTKLMRVSGEGFEDLYTIYKGYELEFVMVPSIDMNDENASKDVTEAELQMLVDFISDMEFVPVK